MSDHQKCNVIYTHFAIPYFALLHMSITTVLVYKLAYNVQVNIIEPFLVSFVREMWFCALRDRRLYLYSRFASSLVCRAAQEVDVRLPQT